MEVDHGHERKFIVCFYEFIGTLLFMYMVLVAQASKSAYAGIVAPLALFALVNIFGSISGGHFNPAVTLGVYIRERKYAKNFKLMLSIIVSQVAGALAGMLLAYSVLRVKVNGHSTVLPQNVPLLVPDTIA